jgi:hypothetical protein
MPPLAGGYVVEPDFVPDDSGDMTIADTGDGGSSISGLAGIFESVGTSITSILRTTSSPAPGQLVYNPVTGTYQPAGAMTPIRSSTPLGLGIQPSTLLLLAAGVLVIVLVTRK